MPGLRKLRGKFYVRLWIDGKEKLLSTGSGDLRDAEIFRKRIEREENEVRAKIRVDLDCLKNRLTIEDGIRYFLANVKGERNLRPATLKLYKIGAADFQSCFQHRKYFDTLRKDDSAVLLAFLNSRYNSSTTVNFNLRSIRSMLNYLLEKGKIQEFPFSIRTVKVDESLPKFIMPDEMEVIYQHASDNLMKSVIRVYETTGMRIGELKISHREGNFIIVEAESKGRRQRLIPIPESSVFDYDFVKANPISESYISHSFAKICKRAGITGKTIHCLRHTFALSQLMATNNLSLVKELLGHADVRTTEIYTKFPREFLKQIFNDRKVSYTFDRAEVFN
ncbi:MAG: hypothetical protein COT43_06990 [Candidatus Marinimicrobia bacterium CG08_land_8_20_14_0_20_45_22]|nr:MAG: hypothetical protein COT43_06990 [Candidatus Marinimicrobia bacterium CG08_land_8_20_14_0_20_45_22]